MERFYLLESQTYLKRNKENYLYQLREQEI